VDVIGTQDGPIHGTVEIEFSLLCYPEWIGEQALEFPVVTSCHEITGRQMASAEYVSPTLNPHVASTIWSEGVRLDDLRDQPARPSLGGFVELSEFAPSQVLGVIRLKFFEYRHVENR